MHIEFDDFGEFVETLDLVPVAQEGEQDEEGLHHTDRN